MFDCHIHLVLRGAIAVLFLPACASPPGKTTGLALRTDALELGCAAAPADLTGDVTDVLSSLEAFDASQPQAYGSESCAGFIFELDNPDAEPLSGAWVQGSGQSSASDDVLSQRRCAERVLETDYWGWKDRKWTRLTSAAGTARFDPATNHCDLEALIEYPGTFERLRIVARVAQRGDTYPMHACVW
jgi:hypothetical protein